MKIFVIFVVAILIGPNGAEEFKLSPKEKVTGSQNLTQEETDVRVAIEKINWKDLLKSVHGLSSKPAQTDHDLDTWVAPYYMRKNFPYYYSGLDDENRPIWVAEIGRWNFPLITEKGIEADRIFEKYIAQTGHRIIKSIEEQNTIENPVTNGVLILDMEAFKLIHLSHIPTISLIIRYLHNFGELIDLYLHSAMVLNTNAAAQGLISVTRPVLGKIMEKAQIYGTNRAKWIPHVLRHCPKSQIPEWYGGIKNFKPVKVYG